MERWLGGRVGPGDGGDALVAATIEVTDTTMRGPELVDKLCHLHIEGAVARDLHHFAFAPPLDGLDAFSSLSLAKRRRRDVFQLGAVIGRFLQGHAEIEAPHLTGEVEAGVAHQDLVIEIDMIVANDKIGSPELIDEGIHGILSKDAVFPQSRAVGHADGHAHVTLLVPAAHIAS